MTVTLTQLLIWIIIAGIVGLLGELIARRRALDGFLGAIVIGFLAIFLVVGVFHFSIVGEPKLEDVPLVSSVIAAAILTFIWSAFAYPRVRRAL